jgi:hypothetical protein
MNALGLSQPAHFHTCSEYDVSKRTAPAIILSSRDNIQLSNAHDSGTGTNILADTAYPLAPWLTSVGFRT